MKKTYLILVILLWTSISGCFAQLKVFHEGDVSLGTVENDPYQSQLYVTGPRNTLVTFHADSDHEAVMWTANGGGSFGFGTLTEGNASHGAILAGISDPRKIVRFDPDGNIAVSGSAAARAWWSTFESSTIQIADTVQHSLESLLKLTPVQYRRDPAEAGYPEKEELCYGFDPGELAGLYPSLVSHPSGSDQTPMINYDGLIPLLVNALKEQQKQIDALKVELDRLNLPEQSPVKE